MKIRYFTVALAGLTLSASALRAQEPTPAPAPTLAPLTDTTDKADKKKGGARMQALTPEEQAKLRDARKAVRKDPAVKAAAEKRATDPKAFQEAQREAMIRQDPSIKAILDKMEAGKGEGKKKKKG